MTRERISKRMEDLQAITENVVDVTFVYDAVLQVIKCRWFLRGKLLDFHRQVSLVPPW